MSHARVAECFASGIELSREPQSRSKLRSRFTQNHHLHQCAFPGLNSTKTCIGPNAAIDDTRRREFAKKTEIQVPNGRVTTTIFSPACFLPSAMRFHICSRWKLLPISILSAPSAFCCASLLRAEEFMRTPPMKTIPCAVRATSYTGDQKNSLLPGNSCQLPSGNPPRCVIMGKYGSPRSGGRDARHPSLKGTIPRRSGASPDSSLPESSSSEALNLSIKPAPKRIFHSSSISRSWLRY
jgi:hypothetical protein